MDNLQTHYLINTQSDTICPINFISIYISTINNIPKLRTDELNIYIYIIYV